jgi:hypothetical protein
MSLVELLARFDGQMRREAEPEDAGLSIERVRHLTRAVGPGTGPEDYCILWSALDPASADAAIAAERDRAEAAGRALEWKVYGHDRPDDLAARLMAQGFEPDEPETLVSFNLSRPLELPRGIRVRRLAADELGAVAAIKAAVWGTEAASQAESLRRTLTELPGRLSVYLAEEAEGRPAAIGWLRKPERAEFASLWGGSTLPHLRGRGFYRALVAARLAEAAEAGYGYALVEARETSRPILERLGFDRLTAVRGYVWAPGRS